MTTPRPPRPRSLTVAVWWWGAAGIAVAAFAVASWAQASFLGFESTTAFVMLGIGLSALALVVGWGTLRLALGHLAGRLTLTALGLIAGLPMLLKGARLLPLAAALLIGVVLLYLPGARSYFKEQVQARRAKSRELRQADRAARRR
ncbi:hypothetical protein [Galactobacter caseinivorans]|uniref:Uncharacterized protein n=1 Tax=Galactobacter caseinivorans TaxID=2676123 RepID=A0A496PLL9_9MICC|nr:hypothetical protein [Galactobacter caseinivorans]RKW71420.1 hypothetical protein DWQ67_00780 [Galactobacter caseinivorans]